MARRQNSNRSVQRPRPSYQAPGRLEDLPLVAEVRAALRGDDPWAVAALASSLVELVGPTPQLVEFLTAIAAVDIRETTAVLAAIEPFVDGDVAELCRDALASRRQPLPPEVQDFRDVRPVAAARFHAGNASLEHVAVEVRTPSGTSIVWLVMIDHALGGAISDAFYLPGDTLADLVDRMFTVAAPTDRMRHQELALADARALLERGIGAYSPDLGLPERDSWPHCRPMLRAVLPALPPGGAVSGPLGRPVSAALPGAAFGLVPAAAPALGHEPWGDDEWDDEPLDPAVAAAIGAAFDELSPGMSDVEIEALEAVEEVLKQTGRDPRYWDEELTDLVLFGPAPVIAGRRCLPVIPDVVRLLIEYTARVLPTGPARAEHLLRHLDEAFDDYAQMLVSPDFEEARASLSAALDDALGFSPRADLERFVGGAQALDVLDDRPLPVESIDLAAVPHAQRELVTQIDEHLTTALGGVVDAEALTAMRRLVVAVAQAAPTALARGRADITAYALAWASAGSNGLLYPDMDLTIGRLREAFGVKGMPYSRAGTLLRDAGLAVRSRLVDGPIGRPDLLTGARRHELLEIRYEVLDR